MRRASTLNVLLALAALTPLNAQVIHPGLSAQRPARARIQAVAPQAGLGVPGKAGVHEGTETLRGGGGPVNDLCSAVTAEALAVDAALTFTGTTAGATEDGDFVPGSDLDGAGPTVWHAFTTTECANVTISYCGTDPVFGSVWIFLSPECPAGTYTLATSYAFDCADGNVILEYANLPAGTYYLPVQFEATDANGPYSIEVAAAACAPPVPYCTDLFNITQNVEPICSVLFAGIDNASCSTLNCGDMLEDFTGLAPAEVVAGSTYSLSVTGNSDGNYNNYFTAFFDWDQDSIFEASYQVGVITNSACGDTISGDIAVPSTALAGISRMRIIKDYAGSAVYPANPCGTYDYGQAEDYLVNVTAGGGGGPVNDLCSAVTAEALAVDAALTFTGTTAGATEDGDFVPGSDLDGAGPTVWHAFTTTECANVTISYCGTDPVFGSVWIFLSPECPAGTYTLATSYAFDCADGNVILEYANLPAGTYYLPVQFEATDANGPYSIEVAAAACAPPVPYCTDLFNITQNMEPICSVLFAGIDNASCSTLNCGDMLEDFTGLAPAEVVAGSTYSLSVTGNSDGNYNNYFTAFFDWDQDSIFEASYQVGVITNSACGDTISGDIAVPSTALAGISRMRIVKDYAGSAVYPANPCGTYDYGQAEDYLVNVLLPTGVGTIAASDWSIFPNPGDGNITIRTGEVEGKARVDVLDMTGRPVHSVLLNLVRHGQASIYMAGQLAAGTYSLRLTTDAARTEQRFMVR